MTTPLAIMAPLVTGAEVTFWLLAPVMVLGALGMVLSKKPVHSALSLAAVMISLAAQYAALEAPFLFAVQIIVYTGAIMMLFLFVIMLVGVDSQDSLVETLKGQRVLAILAGLGFVSLLILTVGNAVLDGQAAGLARANGSDGNVRNLAYLIFSRYVFVFEATSALLITAAIGAMVLAHRERIGEKKGQHVLHDERMQRYAEHGEHPGALPNPGVYARHNGVDTPALLPDGTPADISVPKALIARGVTLDAQKMAAATQRTVDAIEGRPVAKPASGLTKSQRPEIEAAEGTEGEQE